jgi:hypothetical protein
MPVLAGGDPYKVPRSASLPLEREQNFLPTLFYCEPQSRRRAKMSIEGQTKEAAGYVKEEINEHSKTPEGQRKATEGRELRNEGRVEDGKAPKAAPPGTDH